MIGSAGPLEVAAPVAGASQRYFYIAPPDGDEALEVCGRCVWVMLYNRETAPAFIIVERCERQLIDCRRCGFTYWTERAI